MIEINKIIENVYKNDLKNEKLIIENYKKININNSLSIDKNILDNSQYINYYNPKYNNTINNYF